MRALIIEDKPLVGWQLEAILRDFGFSQVDVAATEAAAIAAAQDDCPELIIAESELAHGSAVRAVRAICFDRHIPTIFMIAGPSTLGVQFPEAALLEKPLSRAAVCTALNWIDGRAS